MKPLLRNILVLAIVTALGVFSTAILNDKDTPDVALKNKISPLEIQTLNGQTTTINLERKTILHFWATWCAPCLEELPALYQRINGEEDVQVIAIAVQDNKDNISKFMTKHDLSNQNITVALDPDWKITKNIFQIKKLPTTIFIQDNMLVKKADGPINWLEYIAFPD